MSNNSADICFSYTDTSFAVLTEWPLLKNFLGYIPRNPVSRTHVRTTFIVFFRSFMAFWGHFWPKMPFRPTFRMTNTVVHHPFPDVSKIELMRKLGAFCANNSLSEAPLSPSGLMLGLLEGVLPRPPATLTRGYEVNFFY